MYKRQATALFFLLDRAPEGRIKIERKDYFRFFELGLFGVAINQMLFFEGLSRTSNINAALIMTSTPILVTLMAFLFLKEHLRWIQSAGIALGLAGAVTLILQYRHSSGKPTAMGDLMVFINAASYALYMVCLLYTSPSPRDRTRYRMPSFACKKKKNKK